MHVPSLLNHRAYTLSRKRDSSRRGEVAPRVSSDDLDPVRDSGGGSVRHERECALPAERGRADIALASSQAVCVSSNQYIATGVMQDQGRGCFGDTHCPELAEPALDRAAGGGALPNPN